MNYVPLAVFGYSALSYSADAGETMSVPIAASGKNEICLGFYTSSTAALAIDSTGESQPRPAGYLTGNPAEVPFATGGMAHMIFSEPTTWVCISKSYNPQGLPAVTSLTLADTATTVLPNGTNLFVATGAITIGAKTFTAPAQIRVRSGDVTATANGQVYGLYFP